MIPALFALVCLGLLIFGTREDVPGLGVALAGAGVAVAIARTGLSFRAVRSLAEHRREARTDELTGLANRRSFNESLARATGGRQADQAFAVLLVDLDDFKDVNDTSATTTGTSCSASSPRGCGRRSGATTSWPGSAVTSSPSSCPVPTPTGRRRSPSG